VLRWSRQPSAESETPSVAASTAHASSKGGLRQRALQPVSNMLARKCRARALLAALGVVTWLQVTATGGAGTRGERNSRSNPPSSSHRTLDPRTVSRLGSLARITQAAQGADARVKCDSYRARNRTQPGQLQSCRCAFSCMLVTNCPKRVRVTPSGRRAGCCEASTFRRDFPADLLVVMRTRRVFIYHTTK
jgi:hypothetical protein